MTAEAISVDGDFVRVAGKSYAIRQITSVEVRQRRLGGRGWIIWAILALLFLLSGLGHLGTGKGNPGLAFALGALFAWLAWRGRKKSGTFEYTLVLANAGSEVHALTSTDGDHIAGLRSAIEAAIAGHR